MNRWLFVAAVVKLDSGTLRVAHRQSRANRVALAMLGASQETIRKERLLARKTLFLLRLAVFVEGHFEATICALRTLLASVPVSWVALRAPRVLLIPRLSEPLGLARFAHGPPALLSRFGVHPELQTCGALVS